MKTFQRSFVTRVLLIALITSTLSGCSSIRNLFGGNDRQRTAAIKEFVDANQQYTADAVAYAAARATIRAARKARLMDDQNKWMDFRLHESAVAAADVAVASDLDTWGAEGEKPKLYDAHLNLLRNAQAEVINIAKEFQ